MGLTNLKLRSSVYFGHPGSFWRQRYRAEIETKVNVEEIDKLSDIVNYDAVHLQKAIINRTSERVNELLHKEEHSLWQRSHKLLHLLEEEEAQYRQELESRRKVDDYVSQKEKEKKSEKKYEEDIEREKHLACLKALEREKIAKGIKWSKEDEIKLRETQKMQMEEKKLIEREQNEINQMWHNVLVSNVRRKEHNELMEAQRRKADMRERRAAYDAQIARATRNKNDAVREEREIENRRLDAMRRHMEEERVAEIKRKKEQQQKNAKNFIEGHEQKLSRIQKDERSSRQIDNETIKEALEQLRKERQRQRMEMQRLQHEKQVFIENYARERRAASALDHESEGAADHWSKLEQGRADDYLRGLDRQKVLSKEQASQEYRRHLAEQRSALERDRRERTEQMARVRETATAELSRRLADAHEELRRQSEYRSKLDLQREENLKMMESMDSLAEQRLRPFTKKQQMFKDFMDTWVDKSPGRISTNPVHPFKRVLQSTHTTDLPALYDRC